MELDDFKAQWQKDNEYQSQLKRKNMEQIQTILKEKSSGVLTKVKKKYEWVISILLIGIIANLIFKPFTPWLFGVKGPVFRISLDLEGLLPIFVLVIITLIVIFFYWIKYTSLETQITGNNLKLNLTRNIEKLKRSLQQEISFIILVCVCVFVAARMQSQLFGYGDFWDIFRSDIMIALLAGISLVSYYIFRRIKEYKSYISELKKYLSEFDEQLHDQTD